MEIPLGSIDVDKYLNNCYEIFSYIYKWKSAVTFKKFLLVVSLV